MSAVDARAERERELNRRALNGEPIMDAVRDDVGVLAARQNAEAYRRQGEHDRREAAKPAPQPRAQPPELHLPELRPGEVVATAAVHSSLAQLHRALAGYAAGLSAKQRQRLEAAVAELDTVLRGDATPFDGPVRLD